MSKRMKVTLWSILGVVVVLSLIGIIAYYQTPTT